MADWEALGQMAGVQNRLGAARVREGEHLGPIKLRDRRMSCRTCNYLESIGFLGRLCLLVGGKSIQQ